jgi:transcriptional regulator with XRE-family HTH domain
MRGPSANRRTLPPRPLSRVENGKANPTFNAMEVIANALGLSIYGLWSERLDCAQPICAPTLA